MTSNSNKSAILIDTQRKVGPDSHILGDGSVTLETLKGGLRDGVRLVTVDNGSLRFAILPDRGMGLWKAWHGDTEIGWQSPVAGPVHPSRVPIMEPGGLGWLDGFDELLVRCGLLSNGAPDFDEEGRLSHPLHGLIATKSAHFLEAKVDDDMIAVNGIVDECRFHFHKLRLTSTVTTKPNSLVIDIHDQITNLSGNDGEAQILYHVNFGAPINTPGAELVVPVKEIVPRNEHAAGSIGHWSTYGPAQQNAEEQVYFFQLLADGQGWTKTLLRSADRKRGVSLKFNTGQLPCFTQWKNTPPEADGYVTGLEPGTNYPNPRSFEGEKGRVVKLGPGETVKYDLSIEVHPDALSVAEAEKEIAALQSASEPIIRQSPQADWCA